MSEFLNQLIAQILALIGFFAFPAIQYILLKAISKKEGQPELWYLPKYGFRLVIHNLSRKRTLRDIKYQVITRKFVTSEGISVATLIDNKILLSESFFLFPRTDQILLSFCLQLENRKVVFIQTDKLGNPEKSIALEDFDKLICDYSATVQNFFNFTVPVARRVELKSTTLLKMYDVVQSLKDEKQFEIDRVRNVS
jgi:hypothetical protein